jgi:hypothetical protein
VDAWRVVDQDLFDFDARSAGDGEAMTLPLWLDVYAEAVQSELFSDFGCLSGCLHEVHSGHGAQRASSWRHVATPRRVRYQRSC